ncbi:KEOPS complex subunit Pcc1 [Halobaculum sp. MBLA0147]|uniref:KEOPS complex subunit Pcc1 n=1 Tax=Halobaculum sp. MBLA0147 TaxID=3079934 RepID=UPI003524B423
MSDHRHTTTLSFPYHEERRARLVADALAVEVGRIDDDRSAARVTRDGDTVVVTVEAADPTALRAGINTWTRLVAVAEGVGGDPLTAGGGTVAGDEGVDDETSEE